MTEMVYQLNEAHGRHYGLFTLYVLGIHPIV